MSKIYKVPFFRICLIGLGCFVSFFGMNAQTSASVALHSDGFQWKSPSEVQQIIQQELDQTNATLALPNLTDWSTAMLDAYRSLLTYAKAEVQVNHDFPNALDKAFNQMKNESVPNPPARAMVMDDMQAKKVELVQKLTYQ